jgi:DNA-binding IclR family transcriptional regulator
LVDNAGAQSGADLALILGRDAQEASPGCPDGRKVLLKKSLHYVKKAFQWEKEGGFALSIADFRSEPAEELSTPTGALERGLLVLETVRFATQPLSLGAIAEATGLDASTVHRTLRILMARGYVFRVEPTKTYTVGPALVVPTGLAEAFYNLRRDAHDHLVHLMAETKMTATLLMFVGTSRMAVDMVPGRDRLVPYNSPAVSSPLHSSLSGKLWLMAQPPSQLTDLLGKAPLKRFTDSTITDPKALIAQIEEARQSGWITTRDETLVGVFGLGAPVATPLGKTRGGVCLYANSRGVDEAREVQTIECLLQTVKMLNSTASSLATLDQFLG